MSDHEPNPFVKLIPVPVQTPTTPQAPDEPPSGFAPGKPMSPMQPYKPQAGQVAPTIPNLDNSPPASGADASPETHQTVLTFDFKTAGKPYRAFILVDNQMNVSCVLNKYHGGQWIASSSRLKPAILAAYLTNNAINAQISAAMEANKKPKSKPTAAFKAGMAAMGLPEPESGPGYDPDYMPPLDEEVDGFGDDDDDGDMVPSGEVKPEGGGL